MLTSSLFLIFLQRIFFYEHRGRRKMEENFPPYKKNCYHVLRKIFRISIFFSVYTKYFINVCLCFFCCFPFFFKSVYFSSFSFLFGTFFLFEYFNQFRLAQPAQLGRGRKSCREVDARILMLKDELLLGELRVHFDSVVELHPSSFKK